MGRSQAADHAATQNGTATTQPDLGPDATECCGTTTPRMGTG